MNRFVWFGNREVPLLYEMKKINNGFWCLYESGTEICRVNPEIVWGEKTKQKLNKDWAEAVIEGIHKRGLGKIAYLISGNKDFLAKGEEDEIK